MAQPKPQVEDRLDGFGNQPNQTAFVQEAFPLDPANPRSLMSVDNTRTKRPIVPISRADVTRIYQPVSTWAGSSPLTAPYTPFEHGGANVKIDTTGPNAPDADYMPRTQSDKATQLGTTLADPINTPFGTIEPQDPYPVAGDTAPVAPTLASLTPNTAAVGQPSIIVKATGTGFTPYSVVEVGGTNYAPTTYVSPTELRFPIDTKNSVPGSITVKVLEHNLKTSAATFIFT